VRTLVNYFDETAVGRLFGFALMAFFLFTCCLLFSGVSALTVSIILLPGFILFFIFPAAKKSNSDYLYYFALDGLMMLSSLLLAIASI